MVEAARDSHTILMVAICHLLVRVPRHIDQREDAVHKSHPLYLLLVGDAKRHLHVSSSRCVKPPPTPPFLCLRLYRYVAVRSPRLPPSRKSFYSISSIIEPGLQEPGPITKLSPSAICLFSPACVLACRKASASAPPPCTPHHKLHLLFCEHVPLPIPTSYSPKPPPIRADKQISPPGTTEWTQYTAAAPTAQYVRGLQSCQS
jgi:hypothetical protein